MARTNVCKECGTTEGPWVGTNHNLCKPCADARPTKPEAPRLPLGKQSVTTNLLAAALLGVLATKGRVEGQK